MTISNFQEWKRTGIISSDEKLLSMMRDIVDAYQMLNKIDRDYYMLVCDVLVRDWYTLSAIANARYIVDYPRLHESASKND